MSRELDEIMRRCEAAGLDFSDEGQEVVVYFPGTAGVYVMDGPQAEWTLGIPFEDYEALEEYEASWSRDRQTVECNILRLDRGTKADLGIGVNEYLAGFGEDMAEVQRKIDGNEPLSRAEKRLDLIRQVILRLVRGRPEHLEAYADPRRRIPIDTGIDHEVSVGLSSDAHSLLQESFDERSLTLSVSGIGVRDAAVEALEKIADSVFFAIDESLGLPLALERTPEAITTIESEGDSFPLPPIEAEYDREAMTLYWNARSSSSIPTVQFLAYYHVLEHFFTRARDPDGRPAVGEGKMLDAVIRECLTLSELRAFLAENGEREGFFYGSLGAKKISRYVFRAPRASRHDPRETASRRIKQIRNRIVHAKAGYGRPLLPSSPEAQNLGHDIDLVWFIARKALAASAGPLRV